MKNIILALIQLYAETGNYKENGRKIRSYIRKAADAGADLAVFPECSLTGYCTEGAAQAAIGPDDPEIKAVREAGDAAGIAVCFGYIEKDGSDLYITQELYSQGQNIRYHKTHLGQKEKKVFTEGSSFSVMPAPVCCGIQLCWESHIPDISSVLRGMGAELLLVPYARPMGGEAGIKSWDIHLPARASDNGVYLAACNLLFPQDTGGRKTAAVNNLSLLDKLQLTDRDSRSDMSGSAGGPDKPGREMKGGGLAVYDPKGRRIASFCSAEEHMLLCELTGPLPRELQEGDMHNISYYDRKRPELLTAEGNAAEGSQNRLAFASDYMEGAHPAILERLAQTNLLHSDGYGLDPFCESAREKIRELCDCSSAEIHFLSGGTQANAIIIGAVLRSYQGVLACDTGHVSVHEAGAIEAGGHKVLTLPAENGKLSAAMVRQYVDGFYADPNHDHMVMPGMVYISHPTELGTLYSLKELSELSEVCRKNALPLYLDGARLAAALACPENDVSLKDIAKLCDIFYIGGTKCGALFGEAVVMPDPALIPHFFTIIKQHGALLAKGRILGVQFDTLFTDDLYLKCGKNSIETAARLREGLKEKGTRFYFETPTNQLFVIMENEKLDRLADRVDYSFWEPYDDDHTVIRLATSWATEMEDVERLLEIL